MRSPRAASLETAAPLETKPSQLTPSYPLADYQARSIAERQATKLLELLDIHEAPVDVSRISELPRLEVVVRTTRQLGGLSGLFRVEQRTLADCR